MDQKQDAYLIGYSKGLKNYKGMQEDFNPYPKGTDDYKKFADGFKHGEMDSHTHWTESVVFEGRVKELDADLKDKKMSGEEFKAKYKMTRAEARKKLTVKESMEQIVYKFWHEMTQQEKQISANYGQGKTYWNPQTRRYAVKYPVPASAAQPEPVLEEPQGITADQLNIGDPVVITGDVSFHGATGDIESFGSGKAFVVVNLYNHGRRSFHSSDVTFNDYADSEEEMSRLDGILEDVEVLSESDRWEMKFRQQAK